MGWMDVGWMDGWMDVGHESFVMDEGGEREGAIERTEKTLKEATACGSKFSFRSLCASFFAQDFAPHSRLRNL